MISNRTPHLRPDAAFRRAGLPKKMPVFYQKCQSVYDWERDFFYTDEFVRELFEKGCEFSEAKEEDICETVRELIRNACDVCIREGDDRLTVEFKTFLHDPHLLVQVTDPGPGFDHQKEVRDRLVDSRGLTREKVIHLLNYPGMAQVGGTGIFCLLHLAQSYRFNEKGNQVTAYFNLHNPGATE